MAEQETTVEEWRPCPGFEGLYAVSDLGRVMATPGRVGHGHRERAHVMRQKLDRYGYPTVRLTGNGRRGPYTVHRFVARAFLGEPPEEKPQVNHKNGIKTDNRLENLEWMSCPENVRHAAINGLMPSGRRNARYTHPETSARGSRVNTAKITEIDVPIIRARRAAGEQCSAIALDYDVYRQTIWDIVRRAHWAHVP